MLKKIVLMGIISISIYGNTTQDNKKPNLKMYSCGITRVAFVQELIKAFEKERNISISLNKKGGVAFVIKGLHDKKVDIGTGCRTSFQDNPIEKNIWGTQVAWGALGFIVNSKNPIDNLSLDNIKKILLGKITNWKDISGDDAPIKLYLRDGKKSGVGSTARTLIFQDANISFAKNATKVKSSGSIRKGVIANKYAFAIDDVTSSSRTKGVKLLKIDNIAPTKENILNNKYILRRPFYIYLGDKPTTWARQFLNFALTQKGQDIISKTGTANLKEANGKDDDNNFIFQKIMFKIKSR